MFTKKAGFLDKDIITSINDIAIKDAATAVKILHTIKNMDSVSATVLRGDQEIALTIEVQ